MISTAVAKEILDAYEKEKKGGMVEAWFDPAVAWIPGTLMGVIGGAVGGPLAGYFAPRGKFRKQVLGFLRDYGHQRGPFCRRNRGTGVGPALCGLIWAGFSGVIVSDHFRRFDRRCFQAISGSRAAKKHG